MFFSSPFSCFTFDDILTLVLFLRVFLLSRFGLHIVFCCQRSFRFFQTFLSSTFRLTPGSFALPLIFLLFTFYLLSDKRWRWGDSNPWPMPCKGTALPAELHPLSLNEEFWMKNEEFWFPNEAFLHSSFLLLHFSHFFIFLSGPFRTRTWDLALIRGAL